ncbi:MAG TPA: hypothetical protein VN088_06035 [Nocardioides sp.]|nr:hypothetical protein [Nocardioides sp.]
MSIADTVQNGAVPVALPSRVGQGTAVEQSRAVAQVQAAVLVAQQCPRSAPRALAEMKESCRIPRLAEKAFFRFNRGDGMVTGPSIHLARELARCWGNIEYGLIEMRRDDEGAHQSEMQAFAWDLERNTRNASTFIVPHVRWTKKSGAKALDDPRDIYENNANNGARRVREAIFAVLPRYFTDEAQDICMQTLQDGGGKPLPQRIADAIGWFETAGVSVDQLERRLGATSGKWTPVDLAQLTVIRGSLQRGEIRAEEEFEPRRLTVGELAGAPAEAQQHPKAPKGVFEKLQADTSWAASNGDLEAVYQRAVAAREKNEITPEQMAQLEKLGDAKAEEFSGGGS